jgi:hypothetical protein
MSMVLKEDRPPWARQPREKERSWSAFQQFLAMQPPRSLTKFASETYKSSPHTVYQWSGRWHWLERAAQFDGFMQRSADLDLVEQRREMNERHAKLAKAMSAKVAARINALRPEELSPGEVGRWMQVISMTERLALGEATEISHRDGGPDTVVNVGGTTIEQGIVVGDGDIGDILDRLRALGIAGDAAIASGSGDAEVVEVRAIEAESRTDDVPADPTA